MIGVAARRTKSLGPQGKQHYSALTRQRIYDVTLAGGHADCRSNTADTLLSGEITFGPKNSSGGRSTAFASASIRRLH
jgi:hypothetical protein